MEALLLILLLIVMCGSNIICFLLGAKVGQTVKNGEKVELPSLDPFQAINEQRSRKEAEREQDRISTILANIDNYDGTAFGQQDVPRG